MKLLKGNQSINNCLFVMGWFLRSLRCTVPRLRLVCVWIALGVLGGLELGRISNAEVIADLLWVGKQYKKKIWAVWNLGRISNAEVIADLDYFY